MRFYLLFALITCAFGVAQLQAENARLKQSNEELRGALKAIQQEDSVGTLIEEEVLLGVGYDHVKQGCVNGANLIKYEDKSVDECGDLCDKRDDCVAFEYGVNYGGSGRYKARDCQLQSSDDYKGCSGIHHNLDLYIKPDIGYEHIDAGCVHGANIVLFRDTSISECAEMCDNTDECVAFEYGVARGGAGMYKSRDCQLQSSSNYKDCSGEHHNLDLYIKPIDVGYEKIDAGCVNGHNIALYHHKTIPECAALCNARDDCEAFEYGVDYEGAGRYQGQDCQLQDSANYERCDGTHHNLDLYIKPEINYEHVDQGCVNGKNLVLYKEKSIFECAQLCDQRSDCMAFEYGVNHGGDGNYESRDCQLQSSDNYATCDGEYHNLDLYIKSDDVKDVTGWTCSTSYDRSAVSVSGNIQTWSWSWHRRPSWEYGPHGGNIWSHIANTAGHDCKAICSSTAGCKYYRQSGEWRGTTWCYVWPEGKCTSSEAESALGSQALLQGRLHVFTSNSKFNIGVNALAILGLLSSMFYLSKCVLVLCCNKEEYGAIPSELL